MVDTLRSPPLWWCAVSSWSSVWLWNLTRIRMPYLSYSSCVKTRAEDDQGEAQTSQISFEQTCLTGVKFTLTSFSVCRSTSPAHCMERKKSLNLLLICSTSSFSGFSQRSLAWKTHTTMKHMIQNAPQFSATQKTPNLRDFLPVRVQVVPFIFQLLLQVFDLLLPLVVLVHHLRTQ